MIEYILSFYTQTAFHIHLTVFFVVIQDDTHLSINLQRRDQQLLVVLSLSRDTYKSLGRSDHTSVVDLPPKDRLEEHLDGGVDIGDS